MLFVILYTGGSAISYHSSAASTPETARARALEVASSFGLDSGVEYPLITGGRGVSSVGSATLVGGFFSSSASVDVRPTGTMSIGFQHQDSWWELTLPTEAVEFRIGDSSSVTIWLDNSYVDGAHWDHTVSDCTLSVHNGWWRCGDREIISKELVVSSQLQRRGLPSVVHPSFEGALVVLTPDQHSQMFQN